MFLFSFGFPHSRHTFLYQTLKVSYIKYKKEKKFF
jgi:hypothetical protein